MLLRMCYLHGNTQTWTVISDADGSGRHCKPDRRQARAAQFRRRRRHGVSGANDPPPQRRRRKAACDYKMHVLLSRPQSGGRGGVGGVVRSDEGRRNCAAEPPYGCWSGANRPPTKPLPPPLWVAAFARQPPKQAAGRM